MMFPWVPFILGWAGPLNLVCFACWHSYISSTSLAGRPSHIFVRWMCAVDNVQLWVGAGRAAKNHFATRFIYQAHEYLSVGLVLFLLEEECREREREREKWSPCPFFSFLLPSFSFFLLEMSIILPAGMKRKRQKGRENILQRGNVSQRRFSSPFPPVSLSRRRKELLPSQSVRPRSIIRKVLPLFPPHSCSFFPWPPIFPFRESRGLVFWVRVSGRLVTLHFQNRIGWGGGDTFSWMDEWRLLMWKRGLCSCAGDDCRFSSPNI